MPTAGQIQRGIERALELFLFLRVRNQMVQQDFNIMAECFAQFQLGIQALNHAVNAGLIKTFFKNILKKFLKLPFAPADERRVNLDFFAHVPRRDFLNNLVPALFSKSLITFSLWTSWP